MNSKRKDDIPGLAGIIERLNTEYEMSKKRVNHADT
jgi:hypothetical protein